MAHLNGSISQLVQDSLASYWDGLANHEHELKELQKWLSIVHPEWLKEYNAVKDIERGV
jgi:hypothetical protein